MMKSSYKFFLSMMVLFILMFLLQMQLPKKFVWNPTFYHADRQPFGCYVFDSIMRQSCLKVIRYRQNLRGSLMRKTETGR